MVGVVVVVVVVVGVVVVVVVVVVAVAVAVVAAVVVVVLVVVVVVVVVVVAVAVAPTTAAPKADTFNANPSSAEKWKLHRIKRSFLKRSKIQMRTKPYPEPIRFLLVQFPGRNSHFNSQQATWVPL